MLRIHFTPQDLFNVTVADRPLPLLELGLALCMLRRSDASPVFTSWRRRLTMSLPRSGQAQGQLFSPQGAGPLFLDPPSDGLEDGLDQVRSTPRPRVITELQAFANVDRSFTPWFRQLAELDTDAWQTLEQSMRANYAGIITATWPRIQAGFQAETAWRARILAQQGLQATLSGLSPSAHLNGLTLQANMARELDIRSTGRGLILQPTLFWDELIATYHPDGRVIVIYPAVTPLPLRDPHSVDDSLSQLLGGTRAQALRVLVQQHTTTDLARELDVTPAAASMQARTLRQSGLIVSQRDGKAMWHWCTPLGLDLLTYNAA